MKKFVLDGAYPIIRWDRQSVLVDEDFFSGTNGFIDAERGLISELHVGDKAHFVGLVVTRAE